MTISGSWKRIHSWLGAHAPTLLQTLGPPASEREIRQAEKQVGRRFPAPFRESLKVHNGQESMRGIFDGAQLLPLKLMMRSHQSFLDLPEELRAEPSHPVGPVKPVWASSAWVPITSDQAGNHDVLDLDPAPGGKVGQVVHFDVDFPARKVLAPGFDAFLERLATGLQQGQVVVDVGKDGDVYGLIDIETQKAIQEREKREKSKKASPRKRKRV